MMIQYGQDNTYNIVREGYQKNGSSFWYGENLGINKVNGYYVSHCTHEELIVNSGGQDSMNFSTHGNMLSNVPCGWYSYMLIIIIGQLAQKETMKSDRNILFDMYMMPMMMVLSQ